MFMKDFDCLISIVTTAIKIHYILKTWRRFSKWYALIKYLAQVFQCYTNNYFKNKPSHDLDTWCVFLIMPQWKMFTNISGKWYCEQHNISFQLYENKLNIQDGTHKSGITSWINGVDLDAWAQKRKQWPKS